MHEVISLFVVAIILVHVSGCSTASSKYVHAENLVSHAAMSGRFLSSTRAVRVKNDLLRATFDFGMPLSKPRVSSTRVQSSLKTFNFGQYLLFDHQQWISTLGASSSHNCRELEVVHKMTVSGLDSSDDSLTVTCTLKQNRQGVINVVMYDVKNQNDLLKIKLKQTRGASESEYVCVDTWRNFNMDLVPVMQALLILRMEYVDSLSTEVGFNGENIGKRLSRKKTVDDSKVKQTQLLNVS